MVEIGFENLNFKRLIIHNVYRPNDEGAVAPFLSQKLSILDAAAIKKIEERISSVLGVGSSSLEMEILESKAETSFKVASNLLSMKDKEFILESHKIAELHTKAHASKRWPGGTLVIIEATAGVHNNRCIIVIKAESQAGFMEEEVGDEVNLRYFENLILTPQSRLYKIGVFIEVSKKTIKKDVRGEEDFRSVVFDSNIKADDSRQAAKYFYSGFLGLKIPDNEKHKTRDFYEYTREFIQSSDLSAEEKVDAHNALYTYLKLDNSKVIGSRKFSKKYLSEDIQDDYNTFMDRKGFPNASINKDTSLLNKRLKIRKITFSSRVKITAPADDFSDLVEVVEADEQSTLIRIKGQVKDQA